ncbi:MAG: hypothetical protein WBA99_00930 [Nodosilinea sp.]
MATSFRPFQSQTVAHLVAGYRQMGRGVGQWLRQGRTAAVWGLQVVVYPLYAAVQGLRMGYRQLRATRPWQPLWARLNGTRTPELVESDTPIRALLSVLQPPVVPAGKKQPTGMSLVNRYGRWLRQSRAGAVLTPGRWHLIPFQDSIRGIASDLLTRQVVLVTVDNAIFTGLSDDQQQRLQRAVVLMLAEYSRLRRRHSLDHTLQQPWLPLPTPGPATLPPLRWLPVALRWLQTSPLAAATSLFGEASQQKAIARRRPTATSPNLVAQTAGRDLSTTISGDTTASQPLPFEGRSIPKYSSTNPSLAEAVALIVASPRGVAAPVSSPVETADLVAAQGAEITYHAAAGKHTVLDKHSTDLEGHPATQHQLDPASAIEAQVTQVDYIDAPLVAVLRGLDWVLYVLETWLRGAWAWLQKQW